MNHFDFVFVVLVYRNTGDLKDFFVNFSIEKSKVIVVNSFYDVETEEIFKSIADVNGADFLSVENKGYGAGNNRGIEYALKHYQFKYLVISNADVVIRKWNSSLILDLYPQVIAPKIITKSGKMQNPHIVYRSDLLDYIKYLSFYHKWKILLFFAIFLTKVQRFFFLFSMRHNAVKRIYEPHGAFVLLPYDVVENYNPLYNEAMFLFCEEDHLARLLYSENYSVVYVDAIEIFHKVDGSVKFKNKKISDIVANSYMVCYNYWKCNNKNKYEHILGNRT